MSSIYGIYFLNKQPVTSDTLRPMEAALDHWGADNSGIWTEGAIGLGQLMLWNTPESLREKLPFYDSGSRLAITADARIDNREELFNKLGLFKGDTPLIPDSTLILAAYEKYGEDCVKHLAGDFAFAIWDENAQKLFCARDHLGVKPFFYYADQNIFAFASEQKGLLCLEGIDASVSMEFLYIQMQFQAIHYPDSTLYQKIKRLPPSHCLTLNAVTGRSDLRRYWQPDVHTELKLAGREEYLEGLRSHFEEAVRCRLRSAYPTGAELSGGIDSSSITGVAQQLLRKEDRSIMTFSHVLPDHIEDEALRKMEERKYIDEVIRFNNIEDYEYITSTGFSSYTEETDYALKINDGLGVWPVTGTIAMKRAANKRGVRTVLSGFPGDEMVTFSGKNHLMDYLDKRQYYKFLFAHVERKSVRKKLALITPYSIAQLFRQAKVNMGIYDWKTKHILQLFNMPDRFKKIMRNPVVRDSFFEERFKSYRHYQASRIMSPQVGFRMEAETRAGFYCRTEPRFPMADTRLVQFYLSMPNELKYGGPIKRYMFIQSIAKYLPQAVATRNSKAGNVSPFRKPLFPEYFMEMMSVYEQVKDNRLINDKLNVSRLNARNAAVPLTLENVLLYKMDVLRWMEKNVD